LKGSFNLTGAKIVWETAFAKTYSIDVSSDGDNWNTVYNTSNGEGGTSEYSFTDTANFIRMYSTQRNVQEQWWGNSIWEFEVYGSEVESTSAIESSERNNFTIYPNPTTHEIVNIKFEKNKVGEAVHLSVFNMLGSLVYEKNIQVYGSTLQLNLNETQSLQKGVYFLNINDAKGGSTKKLIIE
jgi:hypothetical protein